MTSESNSWLRPGFRTTEDNGRLRRGRPKGFQSVDQEVYIIVLPSSSFTARSLASCSSAGKTLRDVKRVVMVINSQGVPRWRSTRFASRSRLTLRKFPRKFSKCRPVPGRSVKSVEIPPEGCWMYFVSTARWRGAGRKVVIHSSNDLDVDRDGEGEEEFCDIQCRNQSYDLSVEGISNVTSIWLRRCALRLVTDLRASCAAAVRRIMPTPFNSRQS